MKCSTQQMQNQQHRGQSKADAATENAATMQAEAAADVAKVKATTA